MLDEENDCFWFRGRNQNRTLKSCVKLIWGGPWDSVCLSYFKCLQCDSFLLTFYF